MPKPEFVYVTYIATTPEKLWEALTQPEFTRQWWFGTIQQCEWTKGSDWRLVRSDGRVVDAGEVLEIDPPRHLMVSWRHELREELRAEGFSRASFDIEKLGDAVRLTITHVSDFAGSKLIEGVSDGWPYLLSSLKSLLEAGKPFEETRHWPGSSNA
jgi:uncharacterized protein YndB with AHSA1/START domain